MSIKLFSSLGAISINYPCEYKQKCRKDDFLLVWTQIFRHNFKRCCQIVFRFLDSRITSAAFSQCIFFLTLFELENPIVTSINASLTIATGKLSFDLTCFTGRNWRSCPETNDVLYEKAIHVFSCADIKMIWINLLSKLRCYKRLFLESASYSAFRDVSCGATCPPAKPR